MFYWLKNQFVKKAQVKDRVLVEKARKGDAEAFGQLYLKYLDGIYRYFYFRIGQDQPGAEDLAEQVFFKAWKALPGYKQQGLAFSAWLYRIAHNQLVDAYRIRKETARLTDAYPGEDDTLGKVVTSEEQALLYKSIEALSDDQKQVILLKFVEDFSNREISVITGKREEAIRALQHRALQKLREILETENGI